MEKKKEKQIHQTRPNGEISSWFIGFKKKEHHF